MLVQWYPGHMSKTLQEIEKNLKYVSAVIYVLDARAPFSCLNPKIDNIVKDKPIIYVLNKADLADEFITKKVVKNFENEKKTIIVTNAVNNACKTSILKALKAEFASKIYAFSRKGANGILRAMVIGVPNTGKSTLINLLAGSKKAVTGDKAGVTKNVSWIKIGDNVEIMDTPGTLWPSFEDQQVGVKLALIGSIKDDILDVSELGLECIKLLKKLAPIKLALRYKLDIECMNDAEPIEIFDNICKNFGFIIKGGEFDYERGGKAIVDDFRKGKIGKITLDKINE